MFVKKYLDRIHVIITELCRISVDFSLIWFKGMELTDIQQQLVKWREELFVTEPPEVYTVLHLQLLACVTNYLLGIDLYLSDKRKPCQRKMQTGDIFLSTVLQLLKNEEHHAK